MSEELEILKQVAQRLDTAEISYMVTGSIAANFYTVPRMTRDIDIVVELLDRDVDRFVPLFDSNAQKDSRSVGEKMTRNVELFERIERLERIE